MVYCIIYWKDALWSASTHHMKDVTTVTTFYNINLDYLNEGLFLLTFKTSHERCCSSHCFLQYEIGLFTRRTLFA